MADVVVTNDVDTFLKSANQAAMRTNIGAGTIATQDANNVSITGGSVAGITDLAIADGGTGASTAAAARTNLEVYSDAEVDAKVATKETAGGVNLNSGLIYFSTMPAPRTNDFSFFGTINKQTVGIKRIYGSSQINGNLLMFISATNKIIVVHWGSPDLVSTDSIELNVDTHIGYTRNGTVGTFYINGKSAGTVTDNRDYLSNFANITGVGDGMLGNHKDFRFFNRALSAAEVADLYESGTVAVADRWGVPGGATGCIADLPLDEGIGYQFHDRSSNHFDALASTTGVTHLVPKQTGKVRVKAADASSAMYMLRADSILPTDSIISNVLSEQCYVDLTNSAQTLDDYRIRLNPSGSDLQIQRSDGSNHATLGTVTAPSSLSDVDVQIHYEQVAR